MTDNHISHPCVALSIINFFEITLLMCLWEIYSSNYFGLLFLSKSPRVSQVALYGVKVNLKVFFLNYIFPECDILGQIDKTLTIF